MDIKQLRKIIKEFENSNIHKLEISEKDFTVKLEKAEQKQIVTEYVQPRVENQAHSVNQNLKDIEENNYTKVTSPLVGVYYNSPSPDNPPFVKINQEVQKGDVLCIVEAMKVMNEIRSPLNGVIKKININNETMVEYGQAMIEIEAL